MQNRVFKISTLSLFLMVFIYTIGIAQNGIKSLDKTYTWDKTNQTETIYVSVDNASKKLVMAFEGEISSGDFQLTAYDPEGNKVAGFSLISSGSGNSQVNIKSSEGSGSNSNININSNSNTNSESEAGSGHSKTVTSTMSSSNGKSKSKSKIKNKEGGGTSVSSVSTGSKGAKGIMRKQVNDPAPGKWKIVMEITNVSGTLTADIHQD